MYVKSFKDLIVWQKSMTLVKEVYILTVKFPQSELYGLTSQMRRAAVSIPANIAEGKKRKTIKDFLQFLRIADGSAAELETLIMISAQLYSHIDFSRCGKLLEEVQKMLASIIRKLESK